MKMCREMLYLVTTNFIPQLPLGFYCCYIVQFSHFSSLFCLKSPYGVAAAVALIYPFDALIYPFDDSSKRFFLWVVEFSCALSVLEGNKAILHFD